VIAAEAKSGPSIDRLMDVAGRSFGDRARKAISLYLVAGGAYSLSRGWYDRARSELTFVVSVDSGDDIYLDVHAWVLQRMPPGRQRALIARSSRNSGGPVAISSSDRPEEHDLHLAYDGRRSQSLHLGPHKIRVEVQQDEDPGRSRENHWGFRRDRVVFTAYNAAARDAIVAVLRGMATARNARRQVRLFVATTWGEWMRQKGDIPLRPLTSVVLREGQSERLSADVGAFLANEEAYGRIGMPWHRGYLFKGPPGTGKTSAAKALAVEHELDIYLVPLGAIPNDAVLLRLLTEVPARSMLLLEDIDIVHGAKVRDDGDKGVSLSGLLNGLDGVMTPHGLVTVLTTNDASLLDDALLRDGRVDVTEDMEVLDTEQMHRLAAFVLGRDMRRVLPRLSPMRPALTPAMVVGVFKRHMGDDEAAILALKALIMEGP
jgi:hypothetical protein